jgi:hypothetical protein
MGEIMYSAKVIKTFRGVKDGEVYPREFKAGEVITGEIAIIAVNSGLAKLEKPQELENKALETPTRGGASSPFPEVGRQNGGDTGERAEHDAGKRRGRPRKS